MTRKLLKRLPLWIVGGLVAQRLAFMAMGRMGRESGEVAILVVFSGGVAVLGVLAIAYMLPYIKEGMKDATTGRPGVDLRSGVVSCTECGRQLTPIGSLLDDFAGGGSVVLGGGPGMRQSTQQWLGTVCQHCRKIFCPSCRDTAPGPCPSCGHNVKTALAMNLAQFVS